MRRPVMYTRAPLAARACVALWAISSGQCQFVNRWWHIHQTNSSSTSGDDTDLALDGKELVGS